ncbi:dicarboxylate/amino acid:cation symporter [Membranihabitans maritimus]|uniref:dicarboxylate/amino acid:cation symporter n=1 Tax=Membranihabitans maritimus TaxID=2904244 RepID=UPI001F2431A5|nr:dicarboxylate/amino acid:cation symporter [Membranihabitans maritimus]
MKIVPLNTLSHYLQRLTEGKLWLKVIIAMVMGVAIGWLLSPSIGWVESSVSKSIGDWLALPGNLFLKLVQMIMIPLIFTSIVSGIISNTGEELKKMGLRLVLYFLATTVISISIGLFLSKIFQPGKYLFESGAFYTEDNVGAENAQPSSSFVNIPDSITDLLPSNPLASMVSGEMLSIVIFTIIVGIAITEMKDDAAKPLINLFYSIQEICMTVVSWAMLLIPYAVFGLTAQLVSNAGLESLSGLGYYIIIVLLGLAIMLIVYMVLVSVLGKKNPFSFLQKIREVQLLAFSTTSSAAVMPLSMKTADEKLGVSSKISDFIIPVGATINMDGTAIFQCVSVVFLSQVYGLDMSLSSIVLVMVTILAASIGTPAIPGGGVVILASVLQSSGIPSEGLMIIIGVDRILGMFRTAINVTGDLTACVIFDRWSRFQQSKGMSMLKI